MRAGQHRTRDKLNRRQTSGRRPHQLCWHSFVAAANQNHRVHGLGTQHFLGVHGHEVAQIHAGGRSKAFMQGNGGKGHGQATGEQNAAFQGFDQLGRVAMAGVVGTGGVGNADDGLVQSRVGVAGSFDEGFAQKQRKPLIPIGGQPLAKTAGIRWFERRIGHGFAAVPRVYG